MGVKIGITYEVDYKAMDLSLRLINRRRENLGIFAQSVT